MSGYAGCGTKNFKKNAQHGVKHVVRLHLYKTTKQEKEFERERKKKTCFVIPQFVSGASRFLMVVLYHFDVVKHIKIPGFLHISGISYKKFFFLTLSVYLSDSVLTSVDFFL